MRESGKLTKRQRFEVIQWLAEGVSDGEIIGRMEASGMPVITASAIAKYRQRYGADIERLEREHLDRAIRRGLALKANRIRKLCDHADEIERQGLLMKEDQMGRPSWAKEWRETLEDIASEMGERQPAPESGRENAIKIYVGVNLERM